MNRTIYSPEATVQIRTGTMLGLFNTKAIWSRRYLSVLLATISAFFWKPRLPLSSTEKLMLERRLLEVLARRSGIWLIILLVGNLLVAIVLSRHDARHELSWLISGWSAAFWLLVLPYIYIIITIVRLPNEVSTFNLGSLKLSLCILLTVSEAWWTAGILFLNSRTSANNATIELVVAQVTLIYFALHAQVISTLLLAPSRKVLSTVLAIGFFPPFWFWIKPQLTDGQFVFLTGQLVMYGIVAFFLSTSTRRVQADAILIESERMRARSERARANHFIAAISHDVRQPLTTLALKLRTLKSRLDDQRTVQQVSALQQQTAVIEEMIGATLDLSRLEAGTWNVRVRDVPLPFLLQKVVDDLQNEAASRNLSIKLCCLPYLVKTDSMALERIVRNFITNAIKYTPIASEDAPATILVECKVEQETIRVTVADSGIGIPPDQIGKIFSAYVQLDNPERDRSKGLGLGLSIVEGLSKLLGHQLEVASDFGRGSRFSILVPIAARIPVELLSNDAAGASFDLTDMTVVLIDDDEGPRSALRERLVEWGCIVLEAQSAQESLEIIKEQCSDKLPDFLISDYRLRDGKTGIDAIKEIRRELRFATPAAIWSGETSPQTLQAVSANGFAMLPKPPDDTAVFILLKPHRPKRAGTMISS